MNNNKSLRTENFWIIIIWALIFMLILTWDQEKIVVLNLVLFCYFLYYLVSVSIDNTLNLRRETLLQALLAEVNTQLVILNSLFSHANLTVRFCRDVLLIIIKKLFNYVTTLLTVSVRSNLIFLKTAFVAQQFALQAIYEQLIMEQLQQNIFVSSQILEEVTPLFEEVILSEE